MKVKTFVGVVECRYAEGQWFTNNLFQSVPEKISEWMEQNPVSIISVSKQSRTEWLSNDRKITTSWWSIGYLDVSEFVYGKVWHSIKTSALLAAEAGKIETSTA